MARNYAALLYDYLEEWKELKEAEVGRLCMALMEYSRDGKPIKLSGNERFYAARVMMQEDRFKESYEAIVEQRRKAGKASADKRASTDANESQRDATDANETNNKEIETETEINIPVPIGTGRPRFAPPSVEEVEAYCQERGNSVDPAQFVNFYASKGWKVGREPMKDWKAAVRTWEQRDKKPAGKPGYRAQPHNGTLGEHERAAVERLMHDG